MSVVILSTGYYPDPDIGKPIANGYIYVGTVDLDPEVVANQKTISVLQEDGTEVAVAQPLRTSAGGVPTYSGSPVTIIAASPYSLLVKDSEDVQKIYSPSNTGSSQANEDWTEEGAAVAFDSASTFTVVGDVTDDYPTHRAIKLTQTLDDTGFVVSSVFGAVTTVTVRAATVDSGLTKVEYGIEVAASPGGSSEDFHADTVGTHTGDVNTDTISEETAAAGVTIDGVLCKDSTVTASGGVIADLTGTASALAGTCAPTTMTASAWPSFNVEKNADQINVTGLEKVLFQVENFDTNGDFASSTFTPTVAGKFLLSITLHWELVVAGDLISIRIYKNGALYRYISTHASGVVESMSMAEVVDANGSTDYFEIYVFNGARNTSTISGAANDSCFSGSRIG